MLTAKNDQVMLSDGWYAFGKKLVQVFIPALSAMYFTLAAIWDLPAADKVTGTLAVLATFLGVCLGISSKQYDKSEAAFDGDIVTTKLEGRTIVTLELHDDVGIEDKQELKFRVRPEHAPRERPLVVGDELVEDEDEPEE